MTTGGEPIRCPECGSRDAEWLLLLGDPAEEERQRGLECVRKCSMCREQWQAAARIQAVWHGSTEEAPSSATFLQMARRAASPTPRSVQVRRRATVTVNSRSRRRHWATAAASTVVLMGSALALWLVSASRTTRVAPAHLGVSGSADERLAAVLAAAEKVPEDQSANGFLVAMMVGDPNETVRTAALVLLAEAIGDPRVAEAVALVARDHERPIAQFAALDAVVSQQAPRWRELLVEIASDPRAAAEIREYAIQSLQGS